MKKIRLIYMLPSGFGMDGISNYVMKNYKKLDHNKYSTTFVITKIIGEMDYAKELVSYIKKNGDNVFFIKRSFKNLLAYMYKIFNIFKKNEFDIVHINGSSSLIIPELIIAYCCGEKFKIVHSHNTHSPHKIMHYIFRPLVRHLSDLNLACSREAGRWMFKNNSFHVLPIPVDTKEFKFNNKTRCKYRKKIVNENEEIIIGVVGSFNRQKNQKFVVDIVNNFQNEIKNYKVVFVGDGLELNTVKKLVSKYGLENNFIFLGQRTDVFSLMCAFDVLLVPSLYEGFPTVIIEAQAVGLHVIASDFITKDVKLTNLVEFLPLSRVQEWKKVLVRYSNSDIFKNTVQRNSFNDQVIGEGYSLDNSVELLDEIYTKGVKKGGKSNMDK